MTYMQELYVNSFFSIEGYAHKALFKDCRYPWEALLFLKSYLEKQTLGKIKTQSIPSTAFLINPQLISIGKGSRIEPGAYIAGPCIIGEDCEIRQGAYIRGNVIIGNGCVVGHATEVKNSIFLDGATAAHFNYVGDSILGNEVNLGAGLICANYRLDHREVPVFFNEKKIPTELKKFGAVIGDGAQLGCNCVLNPGTLIGKNVLCYPCLNVSGYIPERAVIKASEKIRMIKRLSSKP